MKACFTDGKVEDYLSKAAAPTNVARGDNNTLCFIYFVERDIEQIREWTDEVIQETGAFERMNTMNHVIASRDDIRNIPTCRLALVFVKPDERQLILEDYYHMGSTRRDTVQTLRNNEGKYLHLDEGRL